MVKIKQVDATMLDKPKSRTGTPRALSPRSQARLKQERQFARMVGKLNDGESVFEVRLDSDEKPLTVRQRLLRAAEQEGKEIVVRKSEKGWLVGLATPERRSRRGRRKGSAAKASAG